jgi:hypothetical protein
MTKFFKGKNKQAKQLPPPLPRGMDELNKAYSDLIGKLGMEELKLAVSKRNCDVYKNNLMELSVEADARQKLDAEEKAKTEQTQAQEQK